ncbi:MAG: hypothetical protein WHX93_14765 [bacterium]
MITDRPSHGAAYLAVLILVLIISLVGLEFLKLKELETHLSQEALRQEQARQAAQAGVSRAAWLLRRLACLGVSTSPNPFHWKWYGSPGYPSKDVDFLQLATQGPAQPFSPGPGRPYYLLGDVRGSNTKVRLRVLGSVDLNGNGWAGLSDKDNDGYPDLQDADPADSNYFLETYLGLPGSLGEDLVLAARRVAGSGGDEISLQAGSGSLLLAKAIRSQGFLYDVASGPTSFNTLMVGQVSLGSPVLPGELFDSQGTPMKSYFQGIPLKEFEASQIFTKGSDPTLDLPQGGVIWVQGDILIEDVDLERDWLKKDLILVASGKLSLHGVHCGWGGRLVGLAREIEVMGRTGEWLNGIFVASTQVVLGSLGTPAGVDCSGSTPCSAKYMLGSIVTGGDLKLLSQGWALVFDPMVLNGIMGWSPPPVLLDRFEQDGLGQWWDNTGGELAQGVYLADEIAHRAGDSGDTGHQGLAHVLRYSLRPQVADANLGLEARLALDRCAGCVQDWRSYTHLDLFMAMDNYKKIQQISEGVTLTTQREARFRLFLRDSEARELSYGLNQEDLAESDRYLSDMWGKRGYKLEGSDVSDPDPALDDYQQGVLPQWKRLRISFSSMDGDKAGFDFQRLRELALRLEDWKITWVHWDGAGSSQRELRVSGNRVIFDPDGPGPMEPSPTFLGPGGIVRWDDPSSGQSMDVPCVASGDCWEVEPLQEADLGLTIRLDRLELPGATMMNHGLSAAFCLEPRFWRELAEDELEP